MNDLFLSIEYNDREMEGLKKFKAELDANYHYQLRPKHLAAAAEGGELWITIFINSEIGEFLVSAILGGITWDLIKNQTKRYVFSPFFKALEKLNEANSNHYNGLNILKLKFQFDDCDIFIGGLNSHFTSVVSTVFQEISNKKTRFEDEIRQKVIRIELPIEFLEHLEEKFDIDIYNDDYSLDVFKNMWRITFETNYPILIYNFKTDKLLKPQEMALKLIAL